MDDLILSNVFDYQAFLNGNFEVFLLKQHVSGVTRKNYRSDLRNFFNWLVHTIQTSGEPVPVDLKLLIAKIKTEQLEEYKHSLLLSGTPQATINRRLSSLRMLFRFAQTQGWISDSPIEFIRNIAINEPKTSSPQKLLGQFRQSLIEEGASETTVKNYVSDVNEFLNWLSQQA